MRRYFHCKKCNCVTNADDTFERDFERIQAGLCYTCYLTTMAFMNEKGKHP